MGITFEDDCLIGAENAFETWVCQHKVLVLTGLAHRGILTEVLIIVEVGILIVLGTMFYLKYKKRLS